MKPPHIILSIWVTLILSSILSVSAAVPSSPPAGMENYPGGKFSTYFSNMVQTGPCATGYVLTGFAASNNADYGKRSCTLLKAIMWSIYGSTAPANTVFNGFKSNGDIRWSPMTTWLKSWTALYYNGGNVGIGTASPTAKLEVAGVTKVDKIQLWNKVVLSWVGDAHGNDGWIRVFDVSQQNNPTGGIAYGNNGIAAANLWARDNVYAWRVTSSNMTVYNAPVTWTDVANKAYVDGKINIPKLKNCSWEWHDTLVHHNDSLRKRYICSWGKIVAWMWSSEESAFWEYHEILCCDFN